MPSRRKVGFSSQAQADFADIAQYTLVEWGEEQLASYTDELFDAIDRLAHFPQMGRERAELGPGIRSFPAIEHVIFYLIDRRSVIVLRILHKRHAPNPVDFE